MDLEALLRTTSLIVVDFDKHVPTDTLGLIATIQDQYPQVRSDELEEVISLAIGVIGGRALQTGAINTGNRNVCR
jgi:hypothetical protein